MRWLFTKRIVLPNPLWWAVAAVIYLWRRMTAGSVAPSNKMAEALKLDQGYWDWCEKECLRLRSGKWGDNR